MVLEEIQIKILIKDLKTQDKVDQMEMEQGQLEMELEEEATPDSKILTEEEQALIIYNNKILLVVHDHIIHIFIFHNYFLQFIELCLI